VGSDTVSNTGSVNATDQAFYIQDSWTVRNTGLTVNAGVRLDQEKNPAYDPNRFPPVNFGWGDKIAPRVGGAYDALRNGKLKVYASYGKFFDTMKLGLTRGSFGSDYWHECQYALDTLDFTNLINPTRPSRFSGDPQTDWGKVMNGYDYVAALNGTGAFAGAQAPLTLASRYGLPQTFQIARQFRLAVRFIF